MTQPSSACSADVALAEHGRALRVDPAGDELCRRGPGACPQHLGVGRHGERVQVRDEVVGVELVLQLDPVDQCPEVVAEVEGVTGGLHPGEDPGSRLRGRQVRTCASLCQVPGT